MKKIISKRFVAWILSLLVFVILSFKTDHEIFQVASSISLLSGIYIVSDSIRKSEKD